MNQQNHNLTPATDAYFLNRLDDQPFVNGVILFDTMEKPRMIEDLGMMYPTEKSKQKIHYALFECPRCGNEFKSGIADIKSGHTKSCGCLPKPIYSYEVGKPIMIKDLGMFYANGTSKDKYRMALFECPYCAKEFKTRIISVKNGNTKSCGCYNVKRVTETHTIHNLCDHRLYNIRDNMINRCCRPTHKSYHRYGGRGITICEEWRNDFLSFYNWAMENGYSDDLTIDRKDNDGNYEPDNCRWVTQSVNCQNKGMSKKNTSGYTGVNLDYKKWAARIWDHGVFYHIGSFNTKEEAAEAYNNWVIEHGTAHTLNIIE